MATSDTTPRRDKGTTLIEMMVVVTLLSIVFAVTTSTFIGGLHGSTAVASRTDETLDARQALDRIGQVLGSAINLPTPPNSSWPGLSLADPYDVRFFAALHDFDDATQKYGGPVQVEYKLVASGASFDLVEDVWDPTPVAAPAPGTPLWSYAPLTKPDRERVLARGVVDTAPRPMFGYLAQSDTGTNADGTAKSSLSVPDQLAVGTSGNLGAGKVSEVASIEVWLTVQSDRQPPTGPVSAVTRVHLPNSDAVSLPSQKSPVVVTPSPSPTFSPPPPPSSSPSPKPTTTSPTPKPTTPSPTTTNTASPTPKPTTKPPTPKPTTKPPSPSPSPAPTGPPTPPDPS